MSSTSGTIGDAVRDAAAGNKETASESGKTAANGDIQADLEGVRNDAAHLTKQIVDVGASIGNAAWGRAKSNLEGVVSNVSGKGQEAADAVREVGDNVVDAIDESLKTRPYTTLALAVGFGFLFGATWRR